MAQGTSRNCAATNPHPLCRLNAPSQRPQGQPNYANRMSSDSARALLSGERLHTEPPALSPSSARLRRRGHALGLLLWSAMGLPGMVSGSAAIFRSYLFSPDLSRYDRARAVRTVPRSAVGRGDCGRSPPVDRRGGRFPRSVLPCGDLPNTWSTGYERPVSW